jgi:hypothetical protein
MDAYYLKVVAIIGGEVAIFLFLMWFTMTHTDWWD